MNKENMDFNFSVQSHLYIGSSQRLISYISNLLKGIFCKNNKCNSCSVCVQIINNAYSKVLWLKPEKQYNLEQIDIILQKISFKLENNEYFFTIFEQADLLTTACSNRLLKSIEEPYDGYYFLFLTQQPKLILPTIYSRCVITNLDKILDLNNYENELQKDIESSEIAKFFLGNNVDAVEFLKIIDKSAINESETFEIVDLLITYWSYKCKKALISNNQLEFKKLSNFLEILNKSLQMLPMPGSSKIFWKNLFINFNIEY